MALNINGTTGISGVDGSASAPALQGTDSNTGINFGSDIVNINTGGTTKVSIDSAGALDVPTDFPIKVNGSEKVRINANGNIGIGNQTPSFPSGTGIEIYDASTPRFKLSNSTTGTGSTDGSFMYVTGSDLIVENKETANMRFYTAATERLRISSDGSISSYNSTYAYLQSNSTTTSSLTLKKSASGANSISYLQCRDSSNGLKMAVGGSGNVTNANNSYGAISDVKLKENIVDSKSQWNDIKAVKVRNYNFKDDSAKTKMLGVVAQEIETVSAGLVSESIDRNPDTGEDLGTTTKNVKYSILYMKAIKCLQEAQARIETLETKVAALEAK